MSSDRGITMSPVEVRRLLDDERTITLATIGRNGMPHLAAMWYALADDTIIMWTNSASQKACNLRRDPRASLLLEAGDSHDELRGFCLECEAEIVTDFDPVRRLGSTIHDRYFERSSEAEQLLDKEARRRIGVRLHVEQTRTWDHRRLAERNSPGSNTSASDLETR
jgi:PPOX class probable F420-dependent enzyme